MSDTSIRVSRIVAAPPDAVFALLADPARHVEFDGSGMVRGAISGGPLTRVGDRFEMDMNNDRLGDYRTINTVVAIEADREIGWSPGLPDRAPGGHTFTFTLVPDGDGTEVAQTYDWSDVTDADLLSRMPRISRAELADSLDRLARALTDRTSA